MILSNSRLLITAPIIYQGFIYCGTERYLEGQLEPVVHKPTPLPHRQTPRGSIRKWDSSRSPPHWALCEPGWVGPGGRPGRAGKFKGGQEKWRGDEKRREVEQIGGKVELEGV